MCTPNGTDQGVRDSAPESVFVAAAEALSSIGIAHLELREPPLDGSFGVSDHPPFAAAIRKAFNGAMILNPDYDFARAQSELSTGGADAIAFGRPFIANPDLPKRFARGLQLSDRQSRYMVHAGQERLPRLPIAESQRLIQKPTPVLLRQLCASFAPASARERRLVKSIKTVGWPLNLPIAFLWTPSITILFIKDSML